MRLRWLSLDVIALVIFVAIGRHTHDHGLSVRGIASTLWPFGAGAIVGWLFIQRRRKSGVEPIDGVVIAVITVGVGMVLRVIFGQGTALAFIVVALAFLNLFFVGWRMIARRIRR